MGEALGSPYGRAREDGDLVLSRASMLFHLLLFIICAGWFLSHHRDTFDRPVFGVSMLITSTWLILGPVLVAAWERRLVVFSRDLTEGSGLSAPDRTRLSMTVHRLTRVRPVFVLIPIVQVLVAYLWAGEGFYEAVGLPDRGPAFFAGLFVLFVGGVCAGWGLWGAFLSLGVARRVGSQRGDYSPFAGVTSRSASSLANFCFPSAYLFGCASAILLPGFCLAAWSTSGLSRGVLLFVVVMLVVITTVLLGYPAWVLDRRNSDDRLQVLDRIAVEIDGLVEPLVSGGSPLTASDSLRLQGLLEIRMHLTAHTMAQASVALVQRIPVAVLLPLSSTVATWYSLSRG